MNTKTSNEIVTESKVETKTSTVPAKPLPTIGEVVKSIRKESRQQPEAYLNEVYVPGGGE